MNQPLSQLTSNVASPDATGPEETSGPLVLRVHSDDNVAVALAPLTTGTEVSLDQGSGVVSVTLSSDVPAGHKIALRALAVDETVIKYGVPIGRITAPVVAGAWVHSHNLATQLTDARGYERRHRSAEIHTSVPSPLPTFDGYRRADGRS